MQPDLIVLLGDYVAGTRLVTDWVHSSEWAPALSGLKAPLGVLSILGNHDWWEDLSAQKAGSGPTIARMALEAAGIPVLENDVVRHREGRTWRLDRRPGGPACAAAGQGAGAASASSGWTICDGTLAKVTDDAPVILLAHEPDIFPEVPARVSLTLSGHTHGGQVRLLGYSPVVPSRFGNRYAYGHVVEDDRHLIVSGGLGFSILPVRFGVRPEILAIELGVRPEPLSRSAPDHLHHLGLGRLAVELLDDPEGAAIGPDRPGKAVALGARDHVPDIGRAGCGRHDDRDCRIPGGSCRTRRGRCSPASMPFVPGPGRRRSSNGSVHHRVAASPAVSIVAICSSR